MNLPKKLIAMLLTVSIVPICVGCGKTSKFSNDEIINHYVEQGVNSEEFDVLMENMDSYLSLVLSGEYEDGVYTTINTKSEMNFIFGDEDQPISFLSHMFGLSDSRNMESGVYYTRVGFDDWAGSISAVSIEFGSTAALNEYYHKINLLASADEGYYDYSVDDSYLSSIVYGEGDEGDIRYQTICFTAGYHEYYLGVYTSGTSLLILTGYDDAANMIDEYCEMLGIVSPTEGDM